MTRDKRFKAAEDNECDESEGFIGRWSRRKQQAASAEKTAPAKPVVDDAGAQDPIVPREGSEELTDADMPPLESLDERSDYSAFMSPKVSDALRQAALRKLFSLPRFNVSDGLDDYNEDFTSFPKLGTIVTHEMRRALERERERLAEKAESAASETVASLEGERAQEQSPNGPTGSPNADSVDDTDNPDNVKV